MSQGVHALPLLSPVEMSELVDVRGFASDGFLATGGGTLLGFLCSGGFSSGLRGMPCDLSSATRFLFSDASASSDAGGSNTNFFDPRENTKLAAEAGDLCAEGVCSGSAIFCSGFVVSTLLSPAGLLKPGGDLRESDFRTGFCGTENAWFLCSCGPLTCTERSRTICSREGVTIGKLASSFGVAATD